MDCSLIPKAVKVTSRRGAKTSCDGYTIHNALIFLPLVLPAPSHFNEALLGGGLVMVISSVELPFSQLPSSLRFLPRGYDDDKVCECLVSCLHSNFLGLFSNEMNHGLCDSIHNVSCILRIHVPCAQIYDTIITYGRIRAGLASACIRDVLYC